MSDINIQENEPFYWLNENSKLFLERGYLLKNEDPKDRIRDISNRAEQLSGIPGFSDKFYYYMSLGFYSLSSPIWSNYGRKNRGLPVSCFGSYFEDNMSSILGNLTEVGAMSKFGGGCSGYIGNIRPRGSPITNNGKTSGSVHFMEMFDVLTKVVSQGSVRRGFFTPYLDIEHKDIEEFLNIATDGNPIQNLTNAVVVGDEFLNSMIDGDQEKRDLWATVIRRRNEIGIPYIMYRDNVERNKPKVYKDLDYKIYSSNMCSEILLPLTENESFVCVLSSINLSHYDRIKNTDAVETFVTFLDTVVTESILKLEELYNSTCNKDKNMFFYMRRAYNFMCRHRALGLGVLGWHNYLQGKNIPFDSRDAYKINVEVFKTLRERADQASRDLAKRLGEPEVLKGYGMRNTTKLAIAPTKSSSFILGQTSQSIEPEFSNFYVKDLAKTQAIVHNKHLENKLKEMGKNDEKTWKQIRDKNGSVQDLDFLSDHDKDVFKTFYEINPYSIINQASTRQDYIDQGQSLNLAINPETHPKDINDLYLYAWRSGILTLYYQFSRNAAKTLTDELANCASCEG